MAVIRLRAASSSTCRRAGSKVHGTVHFAIYRPWIWIYFTTGSHSDKVSRLWSLYEGHARPDFLASDCPRGFIKSSFSPVFFFFLQRSPRDYKFWGKGALLGGMLHWQEIVSRVCVREDCNEVWHEPEYGLASCGTLMLRTHLFQCKSEFGESARDNYFANQSCVVGPISQHHITRSTWSLAVHIKP